MKTTLLRFIFSLIPVFGQVVLHAQLVKGVVTNDEDIILPGAQLWFAGAEASATFTNTFGDFSLPWNEGDSPRTLIIRFVGYQPDTLTITGPQYIHVKLAANSDLETVVVGGRREGQYISGLTPVKTEVISAAELSKGACCDLAGCFNTNATVQSSVTNVITNTKELRILGLGGVYNQVLLDGFPLFQGLSYTYGMSALPGALIENIYISKGANSVLQGWDGISGQINIETWQPDACPSWFANVYMNSFGEKQANIYTSQKGKNASNLIAFHTVQPANRIDRDKDGFLDLPLLTRYSVYDRFHWRDEAANGFSLKAGFRLIIENRVGGQKGYSRKDHEGSNSVYGQSIKYNQPEAWAKLAYRFDERRRIVGFFSGQYHDQDAWYGLLRYTAAQTLAQGTVQYEQESANGDNLKVGVSLRHLDLDEELRFISNPLNLPQGGMYARTDWIKGVFAERQSYFFDDKITWILGARVDHHQEFGWQFTPRTLLKYDPVAGTSVRASAGWGWRMANVFSENVFLLASNRQVLFPEPLQPEKALNWGVNITHAITIGALSGRIGADYYETAFRNQIFPDYNRSPLIAVVENYSGRSVSRAFQTDLDLNHPSGLQFKLAYNFLDVFREKADGSKEVLPFNPEHRILCVISMAPVDKPWQADLHWHGYGKQRLPDTDQNPELFQRESASDPYSLTTAQFTWRFTKWEIYGGCENIFDFRQKQPILSWQDPFGPYFDTSSAWGPTKGREFYLGLRWKLP